eukprot:Gregarina_sp_Poly_1__8564@NODE_507_length_7855_cov_144_722779_g405_i0_p1_GENE_NODE_507_length_7855_cov_144_722779_g405_i0NODE_507_length_7855_cov_144_722779_g405_i0_p1_ORF_typecomplete_len711_score152_05C2/PF00168_30/21C2/PF00168_30/1_6e15C2/PF00168_30/5_3e03Hamartin/PF04388_12/0_23Activator_LAG3/PF11498_8/17_NODE_507_length_7855_cov_144_722779_g405_i043266458
MSLFPGKNVQLKVSIGKLFEADVEIGSHVAIRVESDDNEGTTTLQQFVPGKDFQTSFSFPYEDASEIEFSVVDKNDGVLARAIHSLRNVVTNGDAEEIVELQPRGRLAVHLRFMEIPLNPPKWCTVQVYRAIGLKGSDPLGKIDPYSVVKLDDELVGTTKTIKGGGADVEWPDESWDIPYDNQQLLSIEVFDKDRLSKDDFIGDTVVDLWDFLKKDPKPNIRGQLRLAGRGAAVSENTGQIEISVNFWDDPEEKNREQKPWDEPVTRLPSRKTSSSSSSSSSHRRPAPSVSSSSSSLHGRLSPEEEEVAMNDIRRLADQAAKDAAKAKAAAETAARTADLSPDTPETRRQAARAAEAAERAADAANRAKDSAVGVAPPLVQEPLEKLRKALERAADGAAQHKEDAVNAAKTACAVSAEADAQKARESAQRAHQYHSDTYDIACAHPEIEELMIPLKDADKAAKLSAEAATFARGHADDCERATTLETAIEEAAATRRAAHKAREEEEAAERAYKEAKRLARKEEKKRLKRLIKQQELEEQKRRQEAEAREAARQAEHLQDLERRRVMIAPTDVTENRLYQGVTGYSYHNAAKEADPSTTNSNLNVPAEGAAGPFACCGSPGNRTRGRLSSEDSLHPTIPKHELRGLTTSKSGNRSSPGDDDLDDLETADAAGGGKQILLEQDGIIETLGGVNRPWCWCFGCGCMKCCGEC